MLPLTALQSMRVMIATPCYASASQSNYVSKIALLTPECLKAGLQARFALFPDSLITRARNRLMAKFLSSPGLTHLFFIDADVGFEPEAFFRILLADRDVAAGVYPTKEYRWPKEGLPQGMTQQEFEARYVHYPFNPLPDGSIPVDKDEFGEISEAPTGFMCIKRQVFEKMMAAYPDLDYIPEYEPGEELPGTHWLFFDTLRVAERKRSLSEDYAFCHLWRKIGGKVFMDINSKLSHQGQHIWRGDLKAHLAKYRK